MKHLIISDHLADAVTYGDKRQHVLPLGPDGAPQFRRGDQVRICTKNSDGSQTHLETVEISHTAGVEIEATCMRLNGRLLPSSLYSRDCEQTDNEFAQAEGFDQFTDMRDHLSEGPFQRAPFVGTVIYWGGA